MAVAAEPDRSGERCPTAPHDQLEQGAQLRAMRGRPPPRSVSLRTVRRHPGTARGSSPQPAGQGIKAETRTGECDGYETGARCEGALSVMSQATSSRWLECHKQ